MGLWYVRSTADCREIFLFHRKVKGMVDFLYTDWYNKGRDIRNAKYKGGDWNGQQGRNLKCGAGFISCQRL